NPGGARPGYDAPTDWRLTDFPHLYVRYILVSKDILASCRAAAFFPVGLDAERAAFDARHDIQDGDRNSGGNHEYERHRHAANGQDQENDAADNLIKCIPRTV